MKRVIGRFLSKGVVCRRLLGQLLGSRGSPVGAVGAEVIVKLVSGSGGSGS